MISRLTAQELAFDFHGGQSSHLYSFASTGGVIWNELHREGCRREIRQHLRWAISWLRDASKRPSATMAMASDIRQEQRNLKEALKLDAYLAKAKISEQPYPAGIKKNPGSFAKDYDARMLATRSSIIKMHNGAVLDRSQPQGVPIGTGIFFARMRKDVRRQSLNKLRPYLSAKQWKMLRQSIASHMLGRHPSKAGRKWKLVVTPGQARSNPRHKYLQMWTSDVNHAKRYASHGSARRAWYKYHAAGEGTTSVMSVPVTGGFAIVKTNREGAEFYWTGGRG